jgi:hypothetical protein
LIALKWLSTTLAGSVPFQTKATSGDPSPVGVEPVVGARSRGAD